MVRATIYDVDTDEGDGRTFEDRRRALRAELERLEESATYSGQGQFEQAKFWGSINLWLGVPASVLAAAAGGTALADTAGRIPAGIIALAAAALAAILTVLNSSQRMNKAAAAGNAYLEIQTAARQVRTLDLPFASDLDAVRTELDEISARRNEQNKTADPIRSRSIKKARANITAGMQTYDVDRNKREPHGSPGVLHLSRSPHSLSVRARRGR